MAANTHASHGVANSTTVGAGELQGNRSKSSACAEQDSVEVMWVPCGQLAADLEALAGFGGAQQVHDHVSDGGHVLRSVAGAQAGQVLAEDDVEHPVQA